MARKQVLHVSETTHLGARIVVGVLERRRGAVRRADVVRNGADSLAGLPLGALGKDVAGGRGKLPTDGQRGEEEVVDGRNVELDGFDAEKRHVEP